jgi:two-component system sensor histidine kinase YesM
MIEQHIINSMALEVRNVKHVIAVPISHNIKKRFSSFQSKLIAGFVLCTVIPLLAIGIFAYNISFHIAEDKIINSVILSDNLLVHNINNRFSQMENVADSTQFYMYNLYSKPQNPISEYMDTFGSIRNSIYSLRDTFKFDEICAFVKPDVFISKEGLMFHSLSELKNYGISQEDMMNIGISSKWMFRGHLKYPFMLSPNERSVDSILCARSLRKSSTNSLEYAFFITIKSDELSDLLRASFENSSIKSYLLQENGVITAHTSYRYVGNVLTKEKFRIIKSHADQDSTFSYNSEKYFVNLLSNGWYLVTEIPNSYINENIGVLINIILLSLLIMIPLIIGVTIFISNNLTKKLKKLTRVVESADISGNNITVKQLGKLFSTNPAYKDEIDTLADAFENMVQTIDTSFNNILDLSIQEEKLKYQLLQSQINPHFLYNILGSIQTCQSLGKMDIANQMISDLSKFYKMTLRKSNDLISIKDELEIASLYLNMESLCKDNSFSWEIKMEDASIENFMICKFILQPFLENSIIHGMQSSHAPLKIDITVSYGEDTIIILIQDNGVGIETSHLEELKYLLDNKIIDYSKSFGISNVNARISSELFGSGSIEIESTLAVGTTVKIEFQQITE